MNAQAIFQALAAQLVAAQNAEKAHGMAAYMKNHFAFYGVQTPQRRQITKDVGASMGKAPGQPLLAELCDLLWQQPQREYQYICTDWLVRYARQLSPDFLPVLERLITEKSWWDTVDILASQALGTMARQHPAALLPRLDAYAQADNLWLRRSAILYQLSYKQHTDEARLFAYCAANAPHPDFFIRKAIGWALRQYARTNPQAVAAFVAAHEQQLSPLSKREAMKHLR